MQGQLAFKETARPFDVFGTRKIDVAEPGDFRLGYSRAEPWCSSCVGGGAGGGGGWGCLRLCGRLGWRWSLRRRVHREKRGYRQQQRCGHRGHLINEEAECRAPDVGALVKMPVVTLETSRARPGDLSLLLPEWQGYGVDTSVADAARALASAFPAGGFVEVETPMAEPLALDNGVLGLGAITRQAQRTLEAITARQPSRIFTVAGTCGAELGPVAYLNARYRGDLAVVWLTRTATSTRRRRHRARTSTAWCCERCSVPGRTRSSASSRAA